MVDVNLVRELRKSPVLEDEVGNPIPDPQQNPLGNPSPNDNYVGPMGASGVSETQNLSRRVAELRGRTVSGVPSEAEQERFSPVSSISRGGLTLASNVASAFGNFDAAERFQQLAFDEHAPVTPDVTALEGFDDIASFFGERFIENIPNLGAAGAGFVVGNALLPGVGGLVGAFGASFIPLFGESRQRIREASGTDQVGLAATTGALNTALELIPITQLARRLGVLKPTQKAIQDAVKQMGPEKMVRLRQAGQDFFKVGTTESLTELTQEFNNMVAENLASDKDIFALGPDAKNSLINAAAGGAAAGGTTGAIIGAVSGPPKDRPANQQPDLLSALDETIQERLRMLQENADTLRTAGDNFNPDANRNFFENQPGTRGIGPWTNIGHHRRKEFIWDKDSATDQNRAEAAGANVIFQDEEGNRFSNTLDPNNIISGQATLTTPANPSISLIQSLTDITGRSTTNQQEFEDSYREVFGPVRDMAQQWINELGLSDLKLVIGETGLLYDIGNNNRGTSVGSTFSVDDGTFFIALDLENILADTKSIPEAKQTILETFSHEFGHDVFAHSWQGATDDAKNGVLAGYHEFMKDAINQPYEEFSKKYYSPAARLFWGMDKKMPKGSTFKDFLKTKDSKQQQYLLNFDEYVANQFARRTVGKISDKSQTLPQAAEEFFQDIVDKFRKLFRLVKRETGTTETFKAYVDNLFLQQELKDLIAAREELTAKSETQTQTDKEIEKELKVDEATTATDDVGQSAIPNRTFENGQETDNVNSVQFSEPNLEPIYAQSPLGNILGKFGLGKQKNDQNVHEDLHLGFAKIAKLLTPIQIAELAKKSGFNNPAQYMDRVRDYALTKMTQIEQADRVMSKWRGMGKTKATRISKLLYEVSTQSDEKKRRLSPEEIERIAKKLKVEPDELQMYREIDESFRTVLNNMERGLVYEAARAYIPDIGRAKQFRDLYLQAETNEEKLSLIEQFTNLPTIPEEPGQPLVNPLWTELIKIQRQIQLFRNKNYFPRSRMGEYTVRVVSKAKGQEWEGTTSKKAKETLGFYAFDSKRERDAFLKEIAPDARAAGVAATGGKAETEVFSLMGMPQVMIDKIGRELDLNEEQKEQLNDIQLNLSPGRKFLRHLQKRRGVAGFSNDALRVYANYMMSASNHLARTEHAPDLIQSLNDMDSLIKAKQETNVGTILDDMVSLRDYYRRHFNYLMRPDNDWANLRAVGFLWYLGLNVKSALVNLTQTPLVTYPVLAGRFGDKNSVREIAKSLKDIPQWLYGKDKLTSEEEGMLTRLRQAGIIDESMVMELAGMGEASVMKRAIPGWDLDSMVNKASYYGGAMFRWGEKYNRMVTGVAAYRLARQSGQDVDEATRSAQSAIETSQFEYAKWNRAEFQRGKKSVLFLFWQYMQHASFLFAGGAGSKTAQRMWLMTLLIAGLEGLPFAETILDLLDFSGTQMKKAIGSPNPRVALREDIRDLLLEITDQPDKVLYGLSSYYGLGPLHLANLLGAPVPNVDIQGSLGFGRPVPWLEPLFKGKETDPDARLGEFTAAVLGPVGGMPYQAYRSMMSTDPNTWKNVERAMPTFAKNAMQGTRWLKDGQETFRGEGTFLEFQRPEDRVSALMKTLGFQPTKLSQKYRQVRADQEAAAFWTLKRSMLMEDFFYNLQTDDREGLADAREAIRKHNKFVTESDDLRGLVIKPSDLKQSVKGRLISVAKRERGIPQSKRNILLSREIQRLFPIEETEE